MNASTYFDAAASTPLDPRVKETLIQHLDLWGNNNSKHPAGYQAQRVIDNSLKTIAQVLGCNWEQLCVTYSGTDAARRFLWQCQKDFDPKTLWASAVEHSSILDEIPASQHFDPNAPIISPQARVIALMAANSETGRIYDAQKLRQDFPQALILRDYSQSFAKGIIPDLENSDAGIFTPQKFYGPKHIGILYLKKPECFPAISKDSHTKNPALVAATATAFEIWHEERKTNSEKVKNWDKQIREFIYKNIPNHKFHEAENTKVPGIINVAFAGIRGSELMAVLGKEEGICISTGSACTTDMMSPTHVIKFIESDPAWQYPIRISLHKYLTDADISDFCEILAHYVASNR